MYLTGPHLCPYTSILSACSSQTSRNSSVAALVRSLTYSKVKSAASLPGGTLWPVAKEGMTVICSSPGKLYWQNTK